MSLRILRTPLLRAAGAAAVVLAASCSGSGARGFTPSAMSPNQVFLTPNGETRGWLYVAAKYEAGFIVREGLRGRSSVDFDYRVVAHPHGARDTRLPQINIKPPPIPNIKPPRLSQIKPSVQRSQP